MPLQVKEYQYLATDAKGNVISAGQEPALTGQQVALGTQSAAFHQGARFVRLYAEETCRVEFGENPTATASSPYKMTSGQTEFPGIRPGDKLHVVAG